MKYSLSFSAYLNNLTINYYNDFKIYLRIFNFLTIEI